jgi:hypothetical protein
MSTAQQPRSADPQVLHPLDRLRGTIRRYVVIEGVLSAALFLSLWFALAMLFDFVLFKATGWDWALDGAKGFRATALIVAALLFAAVLYFRIARRLSTEFSYPALALVLERKFPKLLGDRLITAVELADVKRMAQFGYSADMINATVAEARERVAKVPVNEVFNWRRLWVIGALAILVPVLTVVVGFASYAIATKSANPGRFTWKFLHTAGVLAERDLFLQNTPWPRRAHIELVGFPESGEMTVGRDSPEPPKIRARAFQWVRADSAAPTGWRPLMWDDVGELVGRDVPPLAGRYVDDLERLLSDTDDAPSAELTAARNKLMAELGSGNFGVAQEAFKALAARAAEASAGRTVRKLEFPETVTYKFSGRNTSGSGELALQEGTFVGVVADRNGKTPQETVAFAVRAEDFATPPKRIRPIPPPSLKRLYREQWEPAYLHHAPPVPEPKKADDPKKPDEPIGYAALKGKFQRMAPISMTPTGERTVFAVPAGTKLIVAGEAFAADDGTIADSDAIVRAEAIPVSGKFPGMKLDAEGRPTQARVPLTVDESGSKWSVTFDEAFRVTEKVEFKVEWANKYNVTTTRAFVVQATEDAPPTVEVAVDVIRRVGNAYMVTPKARIPFDPASFVKDDRGLQKLLFTFEYSAEDSEVVKALRAKSLLRAFDVPLPGTGVAPLVSVRHMENMRAIEGAEGRRKGEADIAHFLELQNALQRELNAPFKTALTKPKVDDPAADPTKRGVLKLAFDNPNRDYFDLKQLHDAGLLKIAANSNEDVQTIYRFDLWVTATDTNVDRDGGPNVVRNTEPIRLRIVSESDLLAEISKEEEALVLKLDDALAKLAAAKSKYKFVSSANGYRDEVPEQVDSVKVRSQDALQDVEKSRDLVQGVARELRRLVRECEVNRLNDAALRKAIEHADLVDSVLAENPATVNYPKAQTKLLDVQNVLNVGRWAPLVAVSTAEDELFKLEARVKTIRELFGEAIRPDKLRRDLRALVDKQKRLSAEVDAYRRKLEGELSKETPTIGAVGALALNKGETRKVSQTIQWNKYPKDDVVVKVTASDPSIVVPAELKLDFEKNQFRFEYEVKAGAKEGTFKITVTPAVGDAVEFPVVVK